MSKLSVASCLLILTPFYAQADYIELANGDTLRGNIVSMQGGQMIFMSPVLGKLTVPMKEIQSFSSESSVALHLEDGRVFKPVINTAESGFVEIRVDQTAQKIATSQISEINPPVKKPVSWKGNVFAGLNIETGNTRTQETDVDIKANRETRKDRLILNLQYEEDRDKDSSTGDLFTVKRRYQMSTHYDYFVAPKYYTYGEAGWEKETTAFLELRTALGVGGGYRWIETTKTRYDLEAGLSWIDETFTDDTDDDNYMALRTAWRLTHDFTPALHFFNDAEWLSSLEDQQDQLVAVNTGLGYKVNAHLSLDARLKYDWDRSPADDNHQSDLRYILGASWSF